MRKEKEEMIVTQTDLKRQVVALWLLITGVVIAFVIWSCCSYLMFEAKLADLSNEKTKVEEESELPDNLIISATSYYTCTEDVTIGSGAEVGSFRVYVKTDMPTVSYRIYVDGELEKSMEYQTVYSDSTMIEYWYYPDKEIRVEVE